MATTDWIISTGVYYECHFFKLCDDSYKFSVYHVGNFVYRQVVLETACIISRFKILYIIIMKCFILDSIILTVMLSNSDYDIWSSHSVGCETLQFDGWVPMFCRQLLPPLSGYLVVCYLEGGPSKFFWNLAHMYKVMLCMISGFHCEVDGNCVLLGY